MTLLLLRTPFPSPYSFLKTLVYHPTTLNYLAQPHINLISFVFVSILSSFLWFHPQMRCHVNFLTDSSQHDCFPSAAVFHQTRRPGGQMLISDQNHFFLSTQNTTVVEERWVMEQKMTPLFMGQKSTQHFITSQHFPLFSLSLCVTFCVQISFIDLSIILS